MAVGVKDSRPEVVGGAERFQRPRVAVDGSFKVPTLRNVELTGPYFHNGGYATLEQVVDFYSRGGNARRTDTGDTSGYDKTGTNLSADIMAMVSSEALGSQHNGCRHQSSSSPSKS